MVHTLFGKMKFSNCSFHLIIGVILFWTIKDYVSSEVTVMPSIGIIMKKVKERNMASIVWHHTLAIPFTDIRNLSKPVGICSISNSSAMNFHQCFKYDEQMQEIVHQYENIRRQLLANSAESQQIFKDTMSLSQRRTKRGWFDAIGNIAKHVIGVATEEDVKTLADHINQLTNMIQTRDHQRQANLNKMHSYEVHVNDRVTSLEVNVEELGKLTKDAIQSSVELSNFVMKELALPDKINRLDKNFDRLSQHVHLLHQFNGHIQVLDEIYTNSIQRRHDLAQVIEGKLTVNLISPNELREILRFINQKVSSISPNLGISVDVREYYKALNLVTCTHENDYLYLKLRIPISDPSHKFDLFELAAVPVPVNYKNDSEVYTLVSGFKPYLALSKDKKFYLELANLNNDISSINKLPISVNRSSCTSSIVSKDVPMILKECTKVILKDVKSFPDIVQRDSDGSYLMFTPQTEWSVICNNTLMDRKVRNKGLFRYQLHCDCHLKNELITLYPHSETCDFSQNQISYSANMLVYYALYRNSSPLQLTVDNFTEEPFNFQIPNFPDISARLTKYSKVDSAEAYEIANLESALNSSLGSANDDWFVPFWSEAKQGSFRWDTIISAAVNVLEILAIITILVKLAFVQKKIASILLALNRVEAVDFTLPPAQEASTSNEAAEPWKTILIASCTLISLLAICQVIYGLIRKVNSRSTPSVTVLESLKTEVYLCLYNVREYAHIRVAIIPSVMGNIKIGKVGNIKSVQLKRKCVTPFIKIDWTPILITEDRIGKITLPSYVELSYYSYRKINKLVHNSALVKVILVSGNDWAEVCSSSEVINTEQMYQPISSRRNNLSEVVTKDSASEAAHNTQGLGSY